MMNVIRDYQEWSLFATILRKSPTWRQFQLISSGMRQIPLRVLIGILQTFQPKTHSIPFRRQALIPRSQPPQKKSR